MSVQAAQVPQVGQVLSAPLDSIGAIGADGVKDAPTVLGRCTVYYRDSVLPGFSRHEARQAKLWLAPYAQHPVAAWVEFVPKGARRSVTLVQPLHQRGLVVLEGWGHPAPDGIWDESSVRESAGATTTRGRYGSCDPRWGRDLAQKIATHCAARGITPVLDTVSAAQGVCP